MHTFHVHTEDRDNLPAIVARYFDGFTLTHNRGYWKGTAEPSATIEIATDDRDAIDRLAADIKQTNSQESVLVEEYAPIVHFV